MFYTIVGWIVFGLIAGFIARAIVPGKDDIGLIRTVLLGVAGSAVGGFLFGLLTVGLFLDGASSARGAERRQDYATTT